MNTNSLSLTWVPVTDANGRTRMEMRWHVVGEDAPGTHPVPKAA